MYSKKSRKIHFNFTIRLLQIYFKFDFRKEIATYRARSNIPSDDTVFFQLVSGRTEKTNKNGTFRAIQDNQNRNTVKIFLTKALEYEKVNSYTLTLQVRNSADLVAEAQLTVNIFLVASKFSMIYIIVVVIIV